MSWSRRGFLTALGGAAVAGFMRPTLARADDTSPKRIILFFTPHGTVWDKWRPSGSDAAFDLSYILQPLNAFKSKLVVLDGVGLPSDGPGAPHTRGPAVLFTGSPLLTDGTFTRSDGVGGFTYGWNSHRSVDQEIARRLGDVTPYSSLEFGVQSGGGFPGTHMIYSAPAKPAPPMQDPYVAFQELFAGRSADPKVARELTRRSSVLAAVKADIESVRKRVGKGDRERIEAHTQAIADVQRALQSSSAACVQPAAPEQRDRGSAGFAPWAVDRQIELLASSIACGLTRVASLQFRPGENDGGNQGIYTWLGQSSEHHLSTHDTSPDSQNRITEIYRWYASRFAYLLEKLDSFPEGDGTVLDHTMVVWGSEIGEGSSHSIDNIPFVIAGGSRSGVRTGRYLRVPGGTMNNRLLVSMCHYMGYKDVQTYGTVDRGSGPLPGLLV